MVRVKEALNKTKKGFKFYFRIVRVFLNEVVHTIKGFVIFRNYKL